MTTTNPQREGEAAEPKGRADDRDDSRKKTPASDMQADDAGTEASAPEDARDSAGGTPADSAMKQQSKTDAGR
jgi:hypothetical protein